MSTAAADYVEYLRRKATILNSLLKRLAELEPEDAHEIAKQLIKAFPGKEVK